MEVVDARMTGGWGERQVHGLGSHLPGGKCAAPVLPRLLGHAPLQDTGGGNGGGFLDGRFVLLSASFTTSSDFSYARHPPVILQQSAFSRFYCTRRENREIGPVFKRASIQCMPNFLKHTSIYNVS